MDFNETLEKASTQHPLPSLCFRADPSTNMTAVYSDWLTHFRLLLCNCCIDFNETLQEASTQGPLPSLCLFEPIHQQIDQPRGYNWLHICDEY